MTHRVRGILVGCTALILLASPVFAADDQNPSSNNAAQSSSSAPPPDFLLGRPRATLGVRGNWLIASARSDVFDFITEQLTVNKSDFNTGSFAAEAGYLVSPRLTIVAGMDLNAMNQQSTDRNDDELLPNGSKVPISQATELHQMNFTASAKFALLPRGRSVSRLAWIPRTFVPYVGVGAGYGSYELRQNGDFVDDTNKHIFTDTLTSKGWAPTAHILGGTDIQVSRHLILSLEGRYSWQHADLTTDFSNFQPIDLGGIRFGAGIHLAY
jgi:opacity protein-like surface antigen